MSFEKFQESGEEKSRKRVCVRVWKKWTTSTSFNARNGVWNGGRGQKTGGLSCLTFCSSDVFQTEYMKHTMLIIQIFQIPKLPWKTLCLTFSMRNLHICIGQQEQEPQENPNPNGCFPAFRFCTCNYTNWFASYWKRPNSHWSKTRLSFNTLIFGELDWIRVQNITKGSFIY